MKRSLLTFFTLLVLLSGCGSSKKQLEKGNYDSAIDMAVRQLRKDPGDEKQAAILDRSYQIVNEQDNERIRFLKMENNPANWDEIYLINKRLSDRQALVRTVSPITLNGEKIEYEYIDYMPEMVNAKQKAADFYFAHASELMKNNSKESYRQAYYEFVKARDYVADYEGIDAKINESRYLGTSRVLMSLINRSVIKFDKDFEDDLLTIDQERLNTEWVEFYTRNLDNSTEFDYKLNVNIRIVAVSPDQTMQKDTIVKKEVEDGFTYQLDKKGNVMKDSLGNDIKIKKYKTLQCALIETLQSKACRIDGDLEIIQENPAKILKKEPLGAQSEFNFVSARALGDINALSQAQLERTKSHPVPFPADFEMVLRCSENLKQAINGAIQSNKRYIY